MGRHLQFLLHLFWMLPLLPVLYIQGKRLRADLPDLPEPADTKGAYSEAENSGHPLKLLILGESTMAGVGARTHEQAFAGALAKHLGHTLSRDITWEVHAQSGINLKRLSIEVVPEIQAEDAHLVVIGMGANDAFHLNLPFRWRKHVKNLTYQLQRKFPDALIFYCSMPPIKDFTAFNLLMRIIIGRWIRFLSQELKAVVDPMQSVYFDERPIQLKNWISHLPKGGTLEDLFSDGVHPSEVGYQIWAKEMGRLIMQKKAVAKHFL